MNFNTSIIKKNISEIYISHYTYLGNNNEKFTDFHFQKCNLAIQNRNIILFLPYSQL